MAENYYIPPTSLDKFSGVNLSKNMGLGEAKLKISTVGGNAKRAEMGLPQYRKNLNKFISKSTKDISYLDGKETLKGVKAAATGVPSTSPDYSARLTNSLEKVELKKKKLGLSDDELKEIIRKKKAQREALEKWKQEKREAVKLENEASIKTTGSVEMAKLSSVLLDDSPPAFDKKEKVTQTYSQPTVELSDTAGSTETSSGNEGGSEPVLDSEA